MERVYSRLCTRRRRMASVATVHVSSEVPSPPPGTGVATHASGEGEASNLEALHRTFVT